MTAEAALARELTAELLDERLEGYRVLREVGHGAMGVVFEARQHGLDRRVAVKVLPPNLSLRDRTVKRFLREAEAMGRLAHPNIVTALDAEQVGGVFFLAMEYVEGKNLAAVIERKKRLGVALACHLARQAALALQHAHEKGMVHHDVKPSNMIVTAKGGAETARLRSGPGGEREPARARHHPAARIQVALLAVVHRVAARLRRAHHRDARVLVGLELFERIEDEEELHAPAR